MISKYWSKMYCRDGLEKIENYEQAISDKENKWAIHHRLEFTINGEFAHTKKELKRLGMYYHRPYFELIFMKSEDHKRLHGTKKVVSEESKRNMSKARKGETRSEFGRKFKEHFGIAKTDDINLYSREWTYWKKHNHKCRWENE